MKKLLILGLMAAFVLSMSAGILADSVSTDAEVDVEITISEYFDVWFDTPDNYKGLFGQHDDSFSEEIGEPGIYVSDGNATKNSVLNIWDTAINTATNAGIDSGMVNEAYFAEGQIDDPMVELFKVDANTVVDVTLGADFDDWMNAPTLFRVSSDVDEETINGYGDWHDDLALVGNEVAHVNNEAYNDLIDDHNDAVADLNDTFTLDFAEELLCNGPLDFHLNGAFWLPKISQVAADEYSTDVIVTVAAANGNSN
ncbi:MAG: hypothetical protein ACOC4G_04035 [Bacillota bacterium]